MAVAGHDRGAVRRGHPESLGFLRRSDKDPPGIASAAWEAPDGRIILTMRSQQPMIERRPASDGTARRWDYVAVPPLLGSLDPA